MRVLRKRLEEPCKARWPATSSIRVLEKCGFVLIGRESGFANARGAEIEEVVFELRVGGTGGAVAPNQPLEQTGGT